MTQSHHIRAIIEERDRSFPAGPGNAPTAGGDPARAIAQGGGLNQVRWTVSDPSDFDIPDPVGRRRLRIMRFLDEARQQGADPGSRMFPLPSGSAWLPFAGTWPSSDGPFPG